MTEPVFRTIFYPEAIEPLTHPAAVALPAILLVPHAAYSNAEDSIRAGYASVAGSKPELIVLLSALHQSVRPESGDAFLFAPEGDAFLGSAMPSLPSGTPVTRDDSYFAEEPAPEEHAALCAAFFPSVPVLPLLSPQSLSAKQCRVLSSFFSSLPEKTLFIVSSGASAWEGKDAAFSDAKNFIDILRQGGHLLDPFNKKIITACGAGLLEAVLRSDKAPREPWRILSVSSRGFSGKELPPSPPEADGKLAWRIAAVKGKAL